MWIVGLRDCDTCVEWGDFMHTGLQSDECLIYGPRKRVEYVFCFNIMTCVGVRHFAFCTIQIVECTF